MARHQYTTAGRTIELDHRVEKWMRGHLSRQRELQRLVRRHVGSRRKESLFPDENLGMYTRSRDGVIVVVLLES